MFAPQTQREETFRNLGEGIHYATPIIPLTRKTSEVDLVRGVVQMMQGLSSSLFYWDQSGQCFCVANVGIYVTHLSHSTLHNLLSRFTYAATCLQLVHLRLNLPHSYYALPTLRAFASVASHCLLRMRDVALKEEMKMCHSNEQEDFGNEFTPTLLGLSSSLSSLCSAAEYLFQIVHGAIPQVCFEPNSSVPPVEIAVHILDYLYTKLDQVCLVQGGEVEEYLMLLNMFVGSIVPYIEGLDSWLFEGTLDDPFEEMFFYANRAISVDKSEFWEKSYQLRRLQCRKLDINSSIPLSNNKTGMGEKDSIPFSEFKKGKELNVKELLVCPLFIKEISKSIVSAGKSLQLIRHVPISFSMMFEKRRHTDINVFGGSSDDSGLSICRQTFAGLTLSEIFCVSVAGLIGHGDHIFRYFLQNEQSKSKSAAPLVSAIIRKEENKDDEGLHKFLINTLLQRKVIDLECAHNFGIDFSDLEEERMKTGAVDEFPLQGTFFPENPAITACQSLLDKNRDSWKMLNLSKNFYLPPLNDELPNTPTLSSTPRKSRLHNFGIDGLDSLKFTYKVSWPLELIANTESIKKYNQVMGFLLKVKRAKFALDKARRWMWKGRGNATNSRKHHWLVEQKLLHFVDAFHQYVMDRVYHSAWRELCEGMAVAGSLDEVIEVHEAYLLSIQRQCFVVPDKLWALIASRINSILGLALDFYSIQQTLSSSGAASAMKARCEMEVERIEKQFDDCIAFLLRVLSLKLNVGNFPHLADLVTRINYNHFYMSDNGNLMTATGSEIVTSRLGKTFG
ncbi:hypothetical protein POPTR_016G000100v4 [Populus trichocarpa]|uniref:Gamma-tubulin complex component n=1 Tax=Populus trichocarpa TaxID=3694 RepID=A0A3N7H132_POPTR|nr:hypothetical protein POPTR_016G000100v4 [Populus trichocarpa]